MFQRKKGLTWPCEGCQVRPFGASRLATARSGKLLRRTLALLCEVAARLGRLGGRLLREVADVRDVPCWTEERVMHSVCQCRCASQRPRLFSRMPP